MQIDNKLRQKSKDCKTMLACIDTCEIKQEKPLKNNSRQKYQTMMQQENSVKKKAFKSIDSPIKSNINSDLYSQQYIKSPIQKLTQLCTNPIKNYLINMSKKDFIRVNSFDISKQQADLHQQSQGRPSQLLKVPGQIYKKLSSQEIPYKIDHLNSSLSSKRTSFISQSQQSPLIDMNLDQMSQQGIRKSIQIERQAQRFKSYKSVKQQSIPKNARNKLIDDNIKIQNNYYPKYNFHQIVEQYSKNSLKFKNSIHSLLIQQMSCKNFSKKCNEEKNCQINRYPQYTDLINFQKTSKYQIFSFKKKQKNKISIYFLWKNVINRVIYQNRQIKQALKQLKIQKKSKFKTNSQTLSSITSKSHDKSSSSQTSSSNSVSKITEEEASQVNSNIKTQTILIEPASNRNSKQNSHSKILFENLPQNLQQNHQSDNEISKTQGADQNNIQQIQSFPSNFKQDSINSQTNFKQNEFLNLSGQLIKTNQQQHQKSTFAIQSFQQ